MLHIHALGPLSVDGLATRRRLALVAGEKRLALFLYLLLKGRGGVIRRDLLLPLLWPEADETHARSALRSLVREVRSAVGDGVVVSEGDHALGVDVTKVRCDVLEFEAACVEGEWERAVELCRGRLLDGFGVSGAAGFEEWLEGERARLAAQALEACRTLAAEARARGAHDPAVRALRKALTISPYDERVVRELMEAMVEAGDRAGALVAYEEFAARLRAELEVEPGAETVAVAEGVRSAVPDNVEKAVVKRSGKVPAGRFPTADQLADPPLAAGGALAPSLLKRGIVAATIMALTVVTWVGLALSRAGRPHELPRIAVLPFDDRSPDADEYFAAGMTEAIQIRLAALSGLTVIASASAGQYENTAKTPRQIGDELGVAYLLQGTIVRESDAEGVRLRVSPQLIEAADGTVRWASSYEESLGSMFALQSAIAERVADALDIALSRSEEVVVRSMPTTSMEAWNFYTLGEHFWNAGISYEDNRRAAEMYRKAVAIDTSFALAYAALAGALGAIRDSAGHRQALNRALELDPHLPEVQQALAGQHYGRREWEIAVRVASGVLAERPNYARAHYLVAAARRRQSRWEESLESFRRAVELDPLSPLNLNGLIISLVYLGHYDEAQRYARQGIALAPERAGRHTIEAVIALRRDGDTAAFHRKIHEVARLLGMANVLSSLVGSHPYRPTVELLDSAFQTALLETPRRDLEVAPSAYFWARGALHRLRGEVQLSKAYFDSLRMEMERELAQANPDPWALGRFHSFLGIAYAGLGRTTEAVRHGHEGVKLLPIEIDGTDGPDNVKWLGQIYLMIGDYNAAFEQFEILVSLLPGEADELRLSPFYAPLRTHPQFQALVAKRGKQQRSGSSNSLM